MYIAVFRKCIKQQIMYRSEFFLAIVGNLLYIYVQVSIWRALLETDISVSSFVNINQMVTYIIVSYLLRRASETYFTATFADKINRGDIAVDLIRPVSMKNIMIVEQLSENVCTILFSCIPVALVCGLIWGIELVASLAHIFLFVASVFLAIALRFYIEYIAGLCVFWTRNSDYMRQLLGGLILVFSGSTIPLWFYPDWLNTIGMYLPFRLMSFEPIQIYMGKITIPDSYHVILQQVLWLLALYLLERLVWKKIKYNVFVQGG